MTPDADPLDELTDLVRRRFYGHELKGDRLHVNQTVLDALRAEQSTPPEQEAWLPTDKLLTRLTGLPIYVDETLPAACAWQLVDDDGKVLQEGVIRP